MPTLVDGKGSAAAIAIFVLGLSACGGAASPSQASPPLAEHESGLPAESAAPTLAARFVETEPFADAPEGAIEITMTFGPRFEPEEATATAGTVTFFLRNDPADGPPAAHNFLLGTAVDAPPLAASPLMGSRETGILTIEDLAPGTYAYWCTIPAPDGAPHSQHGMVGTLTVTD